jgi:hypothetical protein
MKKIRVDLQLEKNQKLRDLKKRFYKILEFFTSEDYRNPITNKSIGDALENIVIAQKQLN